jgi:calmodulin
LFLGTGQLGFDSFCRVAAHFNEEDDEALQKELKEAFRLYDKEGNGFIPTSSLREILGALDDQLTGDQLNEMIAEIDSDSSGTVDFDGEYKNLLIIRYCVIIYNINWDLFLLLRISTVY